MDEITLAAAASSAALAILVYFMYRSATKPQWQEFTHGEKRRWRHEEERRRETS